MRNRTLVLVILSVLVALACNPLSGLSGGDAGTVDNLWPDVPPYPGASKTDVELPLFARVMVEAATRAIMAGAGEDAGDLEFIGFTTGDSPEDVMAFYTIDRMAGEGWTAGEESEIGCTTGSTSGEDMGGFCGFGKESGGRISGLFIMIVPGSEGSGNDVFYVRIDANADALATAEAQ
jgi:hypothetical protein